MKDLQESHWTDGGFPSLGESCPSHRLLCPKANVDGAEVSSGQQLQLGIRCAGSGQAGRDEVILLWFPVQRSLLRAPAVSMSSLSCISPGLLTLQKRVLPLDILSGHSTATVAASWGLQLSCGKSLRGKRRGYGRSLDRIAGELVHWPPVLGKRRHGYTPEALLYLGSRTTH